LNQWDNERASLRRSLTPYSKVQARVSPSGTTTPRDAVIKWYMDVIVEIADNLEIDYIFAHANESTNSKNVDDIVGESRTV